MGLITGFKRQIIAENDKFLGTLRQQRQQSRWLIKSLLSTSISRRPRSAYSCNNALTKGRFARTACAGHQDIIAGRPAKNCSVLRFSLSVCEPTAANLLKGNGMRTWRAFQNAFAHAVANGEPKRRASRFYRLRQAGLNPDGFKTEFAFFKNWIISFRLSSSDGLLRQPHASRYRQRLAFADRFQY